MVIRINKLHIVILALFAVIISFMFAIKAEKETVTASSQKSLNLPIVMYHHITKSNSRAGKYVVKTSELEEDFDYIQKCGYTCVTVEDLIEFTNGKKQLPNKIIMLTFDDGFESVYQYVWPLLKERGMKAVASPIGSVTETYSKSGDKNVNYAYMSWDELSELNQSDEFEIQNHTYDMHSVKSGTRQGLSRMSGESESAYHDALCSDLKKMQNSLKENSGINATAAVYPYGIYSKTTLEIIKELGFKCSMICEEKINTITAYNANCLYNLGRFNRPSGISSEAFFKKLGLTNDE